jgi:hypothetical protein
MAKWYEDAAVEGELTLQEEPVDKYVAVVGLTFVSPKVRVKPGQEVPAECLNGITQRERDWLINKRKIRKAK